ncbi:MAG: hypothetical protein CMA10_07110 [Euryarchaeota archaeon]|nr:hypothetical protein [Euryarchaeota archaeon]
MEFLLWESIYSCGEINKNCSTECFISSCIKNALRCAGPKCNCSVSLLQSNTTSGLRHVVDALEKTPFVYPAFDSDESDSDTPGFSSDSDDTETASVITQDPWTRLSYVHPGIITQDQVQLVLSGRLFEVDIFCSHTCAVNKRMADIRKLVTPGSIIAKEGEHEHGKGTAIAGGNIVSTVVGYVQDDEGAISVSPLPRLRSSPGEVFVHSPLAAAADITTQPCSSKHIMPVIKIEKETPAYKYLNNKFRRYFIP